MGALLGAVGATRGLQRSAGARCCCCTGFVACAVFALEWGLVTDDFSLDCGLPLLERQPALPYKIGALWGGQAGSLLLWALILVRRCRRSSCRRIATRTAR